MPARKKAPTAKARAKSQLPKPEPGDTFAVPLEDGRYGVCRVLRKEAIRPGMFPMKTRGPSYLIVPSAWVGATLPQVDDPALRKKLVLTHHAWRKWKVSWWVSGPVPDDYVFLGVIRPTATEAKMECRAHGHWDTALDQVLLQWRWEHDRAAVLAEDEATEAAEAEARRKRAIQKYAPRPGATLKSLAKRHFFLYWLNFVPDDLLEKSRAVMTSTVKALLTLGTSAPARERLAVLRKCIESFNDLHKAHPFIAEIEREDICQDFRAMARAAGLGDCQKLADGWATW
jgi:hypothetical protein